MVDAAQADTQVQGILDKMYSNGQFRDLTYKRSSTSGGTHPRRLQILARALNHPSSNWYNNADLKKRIFTSMNRWVDINLTNTNWWHRSIGYPMLFYPAVVIANRNMGPEEAGLKKKCFNYLVWAWKYDAAWAKTGANLTDIGFNCAGWSCNSQGLVSYQDNLHSNRERN